MYTNSLSDDVLYRILCTVKETSYVDPADWASLLPLLSVCSQWRQIGAPVVYSSAFAIAKTQHARNPSFHQDNRRPRTTTGTAPDNDVPRKIRKTSGTQFRNNIHLALHTGNSRFLRSLHIEASVVQEAYLFLSTVDQGFNAADQICWAKMQSLSLNQLCYGRIQHTRGFQKHKSQMADAFVDFITTRMPSIKALDCRIIDSGPMGSEVGNRLASFYAGSLRRIKSLAPLCFSVPKMSPELTHLQLTIGTSDLYTIPLIYKTTLKHLTLCNVPRNYTWASFLDGGHPEKITFPSLTRLEMYYKMEYSAPMETMALQKKDVGDAPAIHFPSLQDLHLFRCHDHCQILKTAVFPKKMRTVLMNCTSALLAHLLIHKWTYIGKLEVTLEPEMATDPRTFTHCTNTLFGKTSVAGCSHLSVAGIPKSIDVSKLEWSQLTALTITYTIGAHRLLQLMDSMPNLTSLSVLSLDVSGITDKTEQQLKTLCISPKTSIKSQLCHAEIRAVEECVYRVNYLAFIWYFALENQSLRSLNVSQSAVLYVQALSESCHQTYPHMSNISICASGGL